MSFQPLCRYLPVISCQVKKIFVPKIGKQIRNICTNSSKYQHISPILLKKLKHAKKPVRFNPKKKDDFKKIVEIWKNITVQELANVIEKDLDHVYELMLFVKDATIYDHDNAKIDDVEVSAEIVKKSGMKCRIISSPIKSLDLKPSKDISRRPLPDASQLVKRPAVVTIMGHVDHGKTTLLDCLRKSSIVDGEFGGITQHIGAFSVKVSETDMITFLDTPGHAAFSTMRARGANVTDIVVLVVAADDGVMEQTVESIRFANEAGVPIIVAINKIDKPLIDLEHCKKSLLANGIQLEDCGGDVQYVEISALKDMGIDSLIDAILTQAELMGLKSDPKGFVEGVIIESKVDPVRGKLATVLVQRGTLRKGSILVAGTAWSKVRAMFQDDDKSIITGPPSSPVEVIGWRELPFSGDEVLEVASEKEAKNVVEWRKQNEKSEKMRQEASVIQQKINEHLKTYREQLEQKRAQGIRRTRRTNMDKIITSGNDDGPVLSVIIKGDVNGSVEAILDVLDTYYAHNKCRLDVVHHSTGVVNENDVILAESFDAIIYAFNVGIGNNIQKRSKDKKIQIKKYNVIYKMIDDVIEEINSKLPDLDQEEIIGEATVLQNFMVSEGRKKVPVAGSSCTKGTLKKNAFFRIYRNQEEIFNGKLFSMKHLKNEVSSIKSGVECGLMFEDHSLFFEHGDWIKCYEIVQVPQKISWDPGF